MRIFNMPQRSPEWFSAHTGVVTGSDFGTALERTLSKPAKAPRMSKRDPTLVLEEGRKEVPGAPTARSRAYLANKVMERVTGDMTRHWVSEYMKRGQALEPDALAAYESHTGHMVSSVGFVMHDTLRIGCSPDGLVGEDGCVEAKCPESAGEMLEAWLDMPTFLEAYEHQVRGEIWLCERQWCDLVVYHPKFPLLVHRVWRDEEKERDLEAKVIAFEAEVTERYIELRQKLNGAMK